MPKTDALNPYAPPSSSLLEPGSDTLHSPLASPWRRLGATLLDTLISLVVLLPLQFAMGVFQGFPNLQTSFMQTLAWSSFGCSLWLAIHGYLLSTRSQTVGKLALGIQIVNASDGRPASMYRTVLLRFLPVSIVALIPFVGGFACVVDVLFIFRKDRRCIHDHVAGTRVIVVPRDGAAPGLPPTPASS